MKKSHYATINAIKCAVQAVVKLLKSSLQVPKDKCTITKIDKKNINDIFIISRLT